MPEPLRIVMADDNYLVREGARRLLEDSGEVDRAGRGRIGARTARRRGPAAAATRC